MGFEVGGIRISSYQEQTTLRPGSDADLFMSRTQYIELRHEKFGAESIDLVTVFDAIFTSRQTRREKVQCLYENLMSNNFREWLF